MLYRPHIAMYGCDLAKYVFPLKDVKCNNENQLQIHSQRQQPVQEKTCTIMGQHQLIDF